MFGLIIYFQGFPNINQIHKWLPHTTRKSSLQERKKRMKHIKNVLMHIICWMNIQKPILFVMHAYVKCFGYLDQCLLCRLKTQQLKDTVNISTDGTNIITRLSVYTITCLPLQRISTIWAKYLFGTTRKPKIKNSNRMCSREFRGSKF